MAKRLKRPDTDWILLAISVFEFSAFALLSVYKTFDPLALVLAAALPVLLVAQVMLLGRAFPHMDRYMLIIGNFLCAVGLIMLYRLRPDKAMRQLLFYGVGIVAMVITTILIAKFRGWKKLRYLMMAASVFLLALTLIIGKETYGAKNWIDLKLFSLQPSELVKVSLILTLASFLSEKRTLRSLLPCGAFAVLCVGLIILQKDLGAVLIYFVVCIVLYYVATSDWIVTGLGMAAAVGGSALLYKLFDHVKLRVAIWRNPWASPDDGGYQIIQSLVAIGSGGMLGMGLGQGSPTVIPVYDTDFIFAALCEEFGILVGLSVLALYVLLFLRGGLMALKSPSSFYALLAVGVVASLSMQSFLIVGGVIKMIPLTGVTLPFISYGGSSMISCMVMLGMLLGVSIVAGENEESAWRRAQAMEEA